MLFSVDNNVRVLDTSDPENTNLHAHNLLLHQWKFYYPFGLLSPRILP
ncbi:hypothetical protein LEP1GSC099_1446 [Leptospira interrogans str. UI 08452]|nr:hypothetical protein LEP1GSC099_1446 [Leptospira interrogans str. UI 08452]